MPSVKDLIKSNFRAATGQSLTGEMMVADSDAPESSDLESLETPKLSAQIRASVGLQAAQSGALVLRTSYASPMSRLTDQYVNAAVRIMSGDQSAFREFDAAVIGILKLGNDLPIDNALLEHGITSELVLQSLVRRGVLERRALTEDNMMVRRSPVQQLSVMSGRPVKRYGQTVRSAVRRSLGLSV